MAATGSSTSSNTLKQVSEEQDRVANSQESDDARKIFMSLIEAAWNDDMDIHEQAAAFQGPEGEMKKLAFVCGVALQHEQQKKACEA